MHPDCVLSKQVATDNSCWQTEQCSDDQSSRRLYDTNLVLQVIRPGTKRPPCMASDFLGKCASITAGDLIQRKKLGSWKFLRI